LGYRLSPSLASPQEEDLRKNSGSPNAKPKEGKLESTALDNMLPKPRVKSSKS